MRTLQERNENNLMARKGATNNSHLSVSPSSLSEELEKSNPKGLSLPRTGEREPAKQRIFGQKTGKQGLFAVEIMRETNPFLRNECNNHLAVNKLNEIFVVLRQRQMKLEKKKKKNASSYGFF